LATKKDSALPFPKLIPPGLGRSIKFMNGTILGETVTCGRPGMMPRRAFRSGTVAWLDWLSG
jgi:hypothetical protein